ncbi:ZIP family metal transporter [Candidatus Bathyarchaeota archaeon]|nr:ZIP family metal transporter [Candidatus Bathyarchaeota archaeon]
MWILGSVILVSFISLIGLFTLIIKEKVLNNILFSLVGFSAGALIGGAFIHLLPEALSQTNSIVIFLYVILGFTLFFLLEKILYWRHCHEEKCPIHMFTYLNLIGDGIHNFIDGLIIAASFIVGIPLGITTTIAVIAHEIPQELGDFGVLIYGGFTKFKALFWNFISALTAVFGALFGYFFITYVENIASHLIPFTAGGFLYIAASDLIPELHKQPEFKKSILSFTLFLIGVSFMGFMKIAFE